MKKPDMRALGALGGKVRSAAKIAACKANAAKAREAAALKRANRLPDFDDGVRVSDLPQPPEPTPPPQPAVITEPAESRKLRDLNPAPKHAPAVDRPKWPPWPNPPVLRTPFEHAVRMAHKAYNPHCVCSFCVP
jgi:hypothetical protein